MKTKKSDEPKVTDFSLYQNYCRTDDSTEKCKKILNSNLDDDLKIELIGFLKNPSVQVPFIQPYVTWTSEEYEPNIMGVEITCKKGIN